MNKRDHDNNLIDQLEVGAFEGGSYENQLQEFRVTLHNVENGYGDCILPIPNALMTEMSWKIGDTLAIDKVSDAVVSWYPKEWSNWMKRLSPWSKR